MKTKNILLLVVIAALIVIIFYSFQGSQDEEAYVAEIVKEREAHAHFLKTSEQSPLKDKGAFAEPQYYDPDIKYRVIADLYPIESKKVIVLTTNDGKEQRYLEYAHAEFNLDGVRNRLLI